MGRDGQARAEYPTAVIGALIVTVANLIARTIAILKELPVGIVTALIGGPFFVYLIQRDRLELKGEGA